MRTRRAGSPATFTTDHGHTITLREVIGHGGASTVYRGDDLDTGRPVAVKVYDTPAARGAVAEARFQREAQIGRTLSSPYLIAVLATGMVQGRRCLVLEHASGGSLRQELDRHGALSLPRLQTRALQLCAALADLHRQGVIHGDLKPANVLFAADGSLKLADYGAARRLTGPESDAGVRATTAAYAAPEQVLDQRLGRYTDIYALGVMLYVLATGRLPFAATSALATALQHVGQPATPPSQLRPDLPSRFDRIVLRCLAKSPRRRYHRVEQIAHDLRGAWPPADRPFSRLAHAALAGLSALDWYGGHVPSLIPASGSPEAPRHVSPEMITVRTQA